MRLLLNRYTQLTGLFLSLFILTSLSFTSIQQKDKWKAPKEADDLKNPQKENASAVIEGQKLFKNMCEICHGKKGKGDGIAGMSLNPRPSNLTSSSVQEQTDGAIYWKMTNGRAPMAAYKEMLSDEQRWQLVNYIRSLKK